MRIGKVTLLGLITLTLLSTTALAQRGGRGGGGGARGGGGGGMARPSGGMARPAGGMSRPSMPTARPNVSMPSRPNMGMPSGGSRPMNRPSPNINMPNNRLPNTRPPNAGVSKLPGAGSNMTRPNFPSGGAGNTRPNLPNTGIANAKPNLPSAGLGNNRPSTLPSGGLGTNRPNTLPSGGLGTNRPSTLPGTRPAPTPGLGGITRPSLPEGGLGNRPGISNKLPPTDRPSTLPGVGGGTNRPTPPIGDLGNNKLPPNPGNRPGNNLPGNKLPGDRLPGNNLPGNKLPPNLDPPNLANRPGNNRPGINLPTDRPTTLPGQVRPNWPGNGGGNNVGNGNLGIGNGNWGNGNWGNGNNWGSGNWGNGNNWGNNVNIGINTRPGWGNGWYGGGHYHPGWHTPGWSGAYWGNWYHGSCIHNGFWSGFATGWATNALFRPNYAYYWYGYMPMGWNSVVYQDWGLNTMSSSWMYSGYANPYATTPATQVVVLQQPAAATSGTTQSTVAYDYANPINANAEPPQQSAAEQAQKVFEAARDSFRSADYGRALTLADQALPQLPNDPVLHEFRGLCLFALQRYDEAAAVVYAVLSAGPPWDWSTMVGLYGDSETYSTQLRSLEASATQKIDVASLQFLLAYHYLVQGHRPEAAEQFALVSKLLPKDEVSSRLAKGLAKIDEKATLVTNTTGASDSAQPEPKPVPASLVGSWTATPGEKVTISLTLTSESKFTWSVSEAGRTQQITGNAGFEEDVLLLAQEEGSPLAGKIKLAPGGKSFVFLPPSVSDESAGLKFSQSK